MIMKSIIPYTKECAFNGTVAEITSISLEHDTRIENGELVGNFLVSGDYKAHEISINKEAFEFSLPFAIELAENLDRSSIEFEINDFTYELLNQGTLKVNIEFSISAEESIIEEVEEIRTADIFESVEDELEDPFEQLMQEASPEVVETTVILEEDEEAPVVEENVLEDRNVVDEVENTVVDSIKSDEDSYITYNIHIIRENENLEMLASLYNSNIEEFAKYNDIANVVVGSKILIPQEKLDE